MQSDTFYGCIIMAFVVFGGVIQGEFAKCLESASCLGVKEEFSNPFFIVNFNHSTCIIFLPIIFIQRYFFSTDKRTLTQIINSYGFSWKSVVGLGVFTAVLRKGDWLLFLGYQFVSVGVVLAIYNSNVALTAMLAITCGCETSNRMKLTAIALSVVSVFIISWPKLFDKTGNNMLFGCVIAFTSAWFIAVYQVAFGHYVKHVDSTLVINLLTGFMGLGSLVVTFPGVFILNDMPEDTAVYEKLSFPDSSGIWALIGVSFCGFMQNCGMQLALSYLSAVWVSNLFLLTIPGSIVADLLFYGSFPDIFQCVGSCILLFAIYLLTTADKPVDDGYVKIHDYDAMEEHQHTNVNKTTGGYGSVNA